MTEQSVIESNKLFVGNLHRHVRWQELKEYFSQRWEVEYASVALDRETKKSRGFGFVTFVNAADAEKAKLEANEKELNGRVIYVDFARAREDNDAQEMGE
jgi:RNA recognition motif-containing protein